jgi:CRISPR-associated exonuclease Cas4
MVGGSSSMKFESMSLCMTGPVIALAVLAWLMWRRRARHAEWRQRPAALRDAQLLSVEAEYRSKGARPIVARVDRAYRLPSGLVTLLELKTRSTAVVLPSDVIQLSAQRIALEDELGLQVSDEAFVLIPARAPAPLAVRSVQLMSRVAIDALVERRWRLMDGLEVPRWPECGHVCRRCGQSAACRAAGERLVGAVRRQQKF